MVRPKRALSQNFLTTPAIAEVVAREAARCGASVAIEIGAGTGVLTRALLAQSFTRVVAIEIDKELVRRLQDTLADERLTVLQADVRHTPLAALADGMPYVVAGNIPYHLTGFILRHIFLQEPLPQCAVLMVQREVAERLVSPLLSLPALWVRLHASPRIVRRVSAGSFFPKPKVDSAIVAFDAIHPNPDAHMVMEVARVAFGQPRKQIQASLRTRFTPKAVKQALQAAGIDPSTRPEAVPLEAWSALAHALLRPQGSASSQQSHVLH